MLPRKSHARRPGLRLALAVAVLALLVAGGGPAAADDAATPRWSLPATGDLLSVFSRNEYNEQDGVPQQVADPQDPARQALRFDLDGGDQRTELQPRTPYLKEGDVVYYSYRASLDPDFPVDVNTWQLILQWHQIADSGSPPIAIEVRDGKLQLSLEGEDRQDLGAIAGGQTVDLVLRIVFSQDRDKGTIDVWNGGRHVLADFHPPNSTLIDEGAYVKTGLYRDRAIGDPARLYLEDLRIGSSAASVRDPDAPALDDRPVAASGSSSGGATTSGGGDHVGVAWGAAALLLAVAITAGIRSRTRRH